MNDYAYRKEFTEAIEKALPKAQVEFVSNFDDVNYGWRISPVPGTLIVFKILYGSRGELPCIDIRKYKIEIWNDPICKEQTIWKGSIPVIEDKENNEIYFDFPFISNLLKYWYNLG